MQIRNKWMLQGRGQWERDKTFWCADGQVGRVVLRQAMDHLAGWVVQEASDGSVLHVPRAFC